MTDIAGTVGDLTAYRGRVLLVVNTASRCGFTPQYEGLEALHRSHGPRGLSILGFPCDQFGGQEPGSEPEIAAFCAEHYDITFPMFAKVEVNGAGAHPLFVSLTAARPGLLGSRSIKWNFTKFLVDREGVVVARFAPMRTPQKLVLAVESVLT